MTEQTDATAAEELSPRELMEYLDRYIVGQDKAKRAVAIALRNRWRRKRVPEDLRDEIVPKNIIMMGPTGVGKTEIARRLSRRLRVPFVKVEASKYTEVGYVGRDVESMVRDLMEFSVTMVRDEEQGRVLEEAALRAEERILDALLPPLGPRPSRKRKRMRMRTRTRRTRPRPGPAPGRSCGPC